MASTVLPDLTRQYSLDEAFSYCAAVANEHYENFPVASLFLPEEKRPYIQAIYAFSRAADDLADERVVSPEKRLQSLDEWGHQLEQCYEGHCRHPVFVALQETIRRNDIPIDLLRDLLSAFRKDVLQHRYETFDDLLAYCRCSANPVGRLVLMVFAYRDEKLFEISDRICTALQLANFWQDVAIDLGRDRVYIPAEDMRNFGYSLEELAENKVTENFQELLKFEVERTRQLFFAGALLPSLVDKDLQLELKLIWFGGMSILKRLEAVKFDIFRRRPELGNLDKLMVLLRGLFVNDLTKFGRRVNVWDRT